MFAQWLKKTFDRKFVAVEMESAGFMNAAYEFGEEARVIVIRGISDSADAKKKELDKLGSGVLRRLAMSNALRALRLLVTTDSLREQQRLRQTRMAAELLVVRIRSPASPIRPPLETSNSNFATRSTNLPLHGCDAFACSDYLCRVLDTDERNSCGPGTHRLDIRFALCVT